MSRTGRISTCEPGRKATAPSRSTVKPPLTLLKITPVDLLALLVQLLEAGPALFAASLVARENGLTESVLDALEVDFDGVADLDIARLAANAELLQRHAAFHLEAHVDDREVLLDANDLALDDGTFEKVVLGEAFGKHRGEVVTRGVHLLVEIHKSCNSSWISRMRGMPRPPALEERRAAAAYVGSSQREHPRA